MTALEEAIAELQRLRDSAVNGDVTDSLRFAKMALGSWPTIKPALEELNRRRIV